MNKDTDMMTDAPTIQDVLLSEDEYLTPLFRAHVASHIDQLEADKAELVEALKTALVFGSNMSVDQTRKAERVLVKMTGDRAWLATPDFGHKSKP